MSKVRSRPQTKKGKQQNAKPRNKKMSTRKGSGESLESKLLYNPCKAMVVRPSYDASGTGMLVRVRAVQTYLTGAGQTAGAIHWCPGLARLSVGQSTGGTTAATHVASADPFATAGGFLTNGIANFRTVAACIRIQVLSSEMARSGTITLGNTTWATIQDNGTYTPDSLCSNIADSYRSPPGTLECVWLPNEADEEFYAPGATYSGAANGKAAITAIFSGLPAATGVRVEFFEVIEWAPNSLAGVVSTPTPPSGKTLTETLRDFWKHHGSTIKTVASGLGHAAMTLL